MPRDAERGKISKSKREDRSADRKRGVNPPGGLSAGAGLGPQQAITNPPGPLSAGAGLGPQQTSPGKKKKGRKPGDLSRIKIDHPPDSPSLNSPMYKMSVCSPQDRAQPGRAGPGSPVGKSTPKLATRFTYESTATTKVTDTVTKKPSGWHVSKVIQKPKVKGAQTSQRHQQATPASPALPHKPPNKWTDKARRHLNFKKQRTKDPLDSMVEVPYPCFERRGAICPSKHAPWVVTPMLSDRSSTSPYNVPKVKPQPPPRPHTEGKVNQPHTQGKVKEGQYIDIVPTPSDSDSSSTP